MTDFTCTVDSQFRTRDGDCTEFCFGGNWHVVADQRYSEVDLSDNPAFTTVAAAFGLDSVCVDHTDAVPAALKRVTTTRRPLLVHVRLQRDVHVWPFVPPGTPNHHMMDQTGPETLPCTT